MHGKNVVDVDFWRGEGQYGYSRVERECFLLVVRRYLDVCLV